MQKLSVFIIAKNEENRIRYTLDSIKDIADEIILIDSGSTDQTISIAKSYNAKIFDIEWQGYVDAKIKGESFCKNDWVLNLDADEALSDNLQQEIKNILSEEQANCYILDIIVLKDGEQKLRKFAPKNSAIRLYNKNNASFAGGSKSYYHDRVHLKADAIIAKCKSPILHRTTISIRQMVDKLNKFTDIQAQELFEKGRKVSTLRLIMEFFISFFKFFFYRRYFIFGIDGFLESFIFAFSKFLRLAKLREKYKRNNHL